MEELATALLDDGRALALALAQLAALYQLGEAEDAVERALEIVAHRREEHGAHALGGGVRVDGHLLRRGELAEDVAEPVDGAEQGR